MAIAIDHHYLYSNRHRHSNRHSNRHRHSNNPATMARIFLPYGLHRFSNSNSNTATWRSPATQQHKSMAVACNGIQLHEKYSLCLPRMAIACNGKQGLLLFPNVVRCSGRDYHFWRSQWEITKFTHIFKMDKTGINCLSVFADLPPLFPSVINVRLLA